MQDGVAAYLRLSAERRQARVEEMLNGLSERERLLVREAAVMGYVRGAHSANAQAAREPEIPPDSAIVLDVLAACDAHRDLYPTLTGYEFPRMNLRSD